MTSNKFRFEDTQVSAEISNLLKIKRKVPINHDFGVQSILTPTNKIMKAQQTVRANLPKFRADLDNEEEDSFSDDDEVMMIKNRKVRESTERADLATENVAIADVIEGVKAAA